MEFELRRLLRAIMILLAHLIMAAIMIMSIWALGGLFHILWGAEPLFNDVPLNYILYLTDVAVLVIFVLNGLIETVRTFRSDRWSREED
jgi:cation transporter-like permease